MPADLFTKVPNTMRLGGGVDPMLGDFYSMDQEMKIIGVMGGLQVDELGHLANWKVPGKMVPGMGGAMDLVTGAAKVVVAMQHAAKGESKIGPLCNLPLTAQRRVSLIVTDLAVIEPTEAGLVLRERAPGVSVQDIVAATAARLVVPDDVPEMQLA
jgi:acetate CoA/acetoacetate CoA-transferase beta subunit